MSYNLLLGRNDHKKIFVAMVIQKMIERNFDAIHIHISIRYKINEKLVYLSTNDQFPHQYAISILPSLTIVIKLSCSTWLIHCTLLYCHKDWDLVILVTQKSPRFECILMYYMIDNDEKRRRYIYEVREINIEER